MDRQLQPRTQRAKDVRVQGPQHGDQPQREQGDGGSPSEVRATLCATGNTRLPGTDCVSSKALGTRVHACRYGANERGRGIKALPDPGRQQGAQITWAERRTSVPIGARSAAVVCCNEAVSTVLTQLAGVPWNTGTTTIVQALASTRAVIAVHGACKSRRGGLETTRKGTIGDE
jgi:hypothetical protein